MTLNDKGLHFHIVDETECLTKIYGIDWDIVDLCTCDECMEWKASAYGFCTCDECTEWKH